MDVILFFIIFGNAVTIIISLVTFIKIKKSKIFHINIKAILFCFMFDVIVNSIGRIGCSFTFLNDSNGINNKILSFFNVIQAGGGLSFSLNSCIILIERFYSLQTCKKYEKSNHSWIIYSINIFELLIIITLKYINIPTDYFITSQIICLIFSLTMYPILIYLQRRIQKKVAENFKNNSIFSLTQKYQIIETEKTALLLLPFIIIVAITTFIIGLLHHLISHNIVSLNNSEKFIMYTKTVSYLRDTISVIFFLYITIPNGKPIRIFKKKLFKNRISTEGSNKKNSLDMDGNLYFKQLDKQWL